MSKEALVTLYEKEANMGNSLEFLGTNDSSCMIGSFSPICNENSNKVINSINTKKSYSTMDETQTKDKRVRMNSSAVEEDFILGCRRKF